MSSQCYHHQYFNWNSNSILPSSWIKHDVSIQIQRVVGVLCASSFWNKNVNAKNVRKHAMNNTKGFRISGIFLLVHLQICFNEQLYYCVYKTNLTNNYNTIILYTLDQYRLRNFLLAKKTGMKWHGTEIVFFLAKAECNQVNLLGIHLDWTTFYSTLWYKGELNDVWI